MREVHEEAHMAHMGAIAGLSVSEAGAEEEVEWEVESEGESVGLEVEATSDGDQSRWLAALQSLGVVEEGVIATAVCTRGEYARSLMASTTLLTRYPLSGSHPSYSLGRMPHDLFPPSLWQRPGCASVPPHVRGGHLPTSIRRHSTHPPTLRSNSR